jgi:hypothetical protein
VRLAAGPHLRFSAFHMVHLEPVCLRRCTMLDMASAMPSHRAPCSWAASALFSISYGPFGTDMFAALHDARHGFLPFRRT